MSYVIDLAGIMHNKYARQPEKLRAWQSASRGERAPQREKKKPEADKGKAMHTDSGGFLLRRGGIRVGRGGIGFGLVSRYRRVPTPRRLRVRFE